MHKNHNVITVAVLKLIKISKFAVVDLKGLFHQACLARVVSLFASVTAIFMVHENGDEQRQVKR